MNPDKDATVPAWEPDPDHDATLCANPDCDAPDCDGCVYWEREDVRDFHRERVDDELEAQWDREC